MASSFLYPPNRNTLSTNVIGNVMQRVTVPQDPRAAAISHDMHEEHLRRKRSYRPHPYSFRQPLPMNHNIPAIDVQVGGASSVRATAVIPARMPSPEPSPSANEKSAQASARVTCSSGSKRTKSTSHSDLQKLRHRQRCRENQRLYRQKQRDLKASLESQIQSLQSEIRELNERSYSFSPVLTTQPTMWVVAGQYFQHLQNFCADPIASRIRAHDFLLATMARDVMDGDLVGVEELLDSWTRFSLFFDNIHVTLTGLSAPASDTLVAKTITSVTFSENSFRYGFPQSNNKGGTGPERQARSRIAEKLLGQRVVMRGSVRFYWNSEANRVARTQSQSDMLTPLLSILDSMEDVSRVFENAFVTPECRMVHVVRK